MKREVSFVMKDFLILHRYFHIENPIHLFGIVN